MTYFGAYQTYNAGLNYNQQTRYFAQPQSSNLTGFGDPLAALDSGLNLLNSFSQPQQFSFQPQQSNYFAPSQPSNAQQWGNAMGVMQAANMDFMNAMGQQFAIQNQIQNNGGFAQPNDPMAANKMMGAYMEEMGKDLKDDGIINGSHRQQNKMQQMMQQMMQMMMMFMMMMMQMMGMGPKPQQQPAPNQPMAQANASSPFAAASASAGPGGASASASSGGSHASASCRPAHHNHNHQKPMNMMQGMAMMFAGMDKMDNGQIDGSIFRTMLQA